MSTAILEEPPIAALRTAAGQLARSPHGRAAAQAILQFLRGPGAALDRFNQAAALVLIAGAYDRYAGTVRDLLAHAAAAGKDGEL